MDEFLAGRWIVGDPENNREVLRGIRQVIGRVWLCPELANVHIGVFFLKYSQWMRRFHIFTFLISHPLVFYIPVLRNPPPQAPDSVWFVLVDVCPGVLYYRTEGELNWRVRCTLFRRPSPPFWSNPLVPILH